VIRIPRTELDYAVATLVACAQAARDARGLRIMFPITADQAERAILAALATLAPGTLPQIVMPVDVHEIDLDAYNAQHAPQQARTGSLVHGRSEGEGLRASPFPGPAEMVPGGRGVPNHEQAELGLDMPSEQAAADIMPKSVRID
jgi:hypothetical protein